jgi:hypothetical protein
MLSSYLDPTPPAPFTPANTVAVAPLSRPRPRPVLFPVFLLSVIVVKCAILQASTGSEGSSSQLCGVQ